MKKRSLAVVALSVFVLLAGCRSTPKPLRTIGFMTDFDVKDDAVGLCKAVMETIAPGVKVIDITHQVTPFSIAEGSRFLYGSAPYFPQDAVIAVVVDPTVGSKRKAIIAKNRIGQFYVLPDNGLLTPFLKDGTIEAAREITNTDWMIGSKLSSTFHGRDIFSPAAAHLARGDDWTAAGPALEVASLVKIDFPTATIDAKGLHAEVIGTDGPFGNLVLNVPRESFEKLGYTLGDLVPLELAGKSYMLPFVKTFSDVPVGKELFYIDSRGRLSIARNQGNYSEANHVPEHATLFIPKKTSDTQMVK